LIAARPRNILLVSGTLLLLLVLVMLGALVFGAVSIRLEDLITLFRNDTANPVARTIILDLRLPRVLLAACVGFGLAQCGVVFQTLLRNPLAEPFILGISSGSALGAILAIVTGLSFPSAVPLCAFMGGLITIALILSISQFKGPVNTTTLLLTGVILNAFFYSIILFFVTTTSEEKLHALLFWLYGDLGRSRFSHVWTLAPVVLLGGAFLFGYAKSLNLLSAGEEAAHHMGLEVERTKVTLFVAVSLITGCVVSMSGVIGFVGLIVPHLVRMVLGSDHRVLLPSAGLFGACFLVAADTGARTIIAPSELPVGVITAFIGAPFFILILNRRGSGWGA